LLLEKGSAMDGNRAALLARLIGRGVQHQN
jgi:hypothetical protein